MTNPFVPPRPYTGDCSWKDWVGHFEAVAKVNGWDNATKLNWLPVQLTGEALTAWNDLTEEARGDCKSAMEELQERLRKTSKGKGKCFCCYSSIRRLFTEPCYTMFKACIMFIMTALGLSVLAYCLHWNFNMTSQVRKTFENPMPPSLIREGFHFPRKEEDEIRDAFLNKTDTLGLVGVVFGPAGTGKSNVVRRVCIYEVPSGNPDVTEYKGISGVIYMEIGSPRRFAYHLAKACGVPVEPNWYDAVTSTLFSSWRTSLTLSNNDEDALASVLPIIAEGARAYKEKHNKIIPVLFIDGADILAKQIDKSLYTNLVDWAKKCANEDSLQIVLVSSDSHVLALDQQSFKSRLADLIEVNDVTKNDAVDLMTHKFHFDKYFAELIYDIIGGRLADIHKVVAIMRKETHRRIHRKVVEAMNKPNSTHAVFVALNETNSSEVIEDRANDLTNETMKFAILEMMHQYEWQLKCNSERINISREVVDVVNRIKSDEELKDAIYETLKTTKKMSSGDSSYYLVDKRRRCLVIAGILEWNWLNELAAKIKRGFVREMEQAFCKVLGNDTYRWSLKEYIITSVLETKENRTVEQIALSYAKRHNTSPQSVIKVIQEFLNNNVLRITKDRTLQCYNKVAEELLRNFTKQERQDRTEEHRLTQTMGTEFQREETERHDEAEVTERPDEAEETERHDEAEETERLDETEVAAESENTGQDNSEEKDSFKEHRDLTSSAGKEEL
eukprot:Em0001g1482a